MTRFLSEALSAPEPSFRLGVRKLEEAHGSPNHDIRLTGEIKSSIAQKSRELGLDASQASAEELYRALELKMANDNTRLVKKLRTSAATHVNAEADVIDGMIHEIKKLPESKDCFAIRNSSLKSLLKKQPPKKAMKQLGYRSFDSFIKHEQPVMILAAAHMSEDAHWRSKFNEQYKKLKSSDFETRQVQLIQPKGAKWQDLAKTTAEHSKHNLVSLQEAGALIFLPLPAGAPDGAVTLSLSLSLRELNHIRAASTLLKLSQVRKDFGTIVQKVATHDSEVSYSTFDQPISWHLIQQYYVRMADKFRQELFEPHLLQDDIAWESIENSLAKIESSFEFWQNTHHLAVLHNHQPVSFNILDVAINYCNELSFDDRISKYLQVSLWQELLLKYIKHDKVEQTVLNRLQPKLVEEPAII